jgi:hypothetical protein
MDDHEVHLTLGGAGPETIAAIVGSVAGVKVHCVSLLSSDGDSVVTEQRMLTWQVYGSLGCATESIEAIQPVIQKYGATIERVKVEAPLQGTVQHPFRYLEQHVLLEGEADRLLALTSLFEACDTRLSRTPRIAQGTKVLKFANQRWWPPETVRDGVFHFDLLLNGIRATEGISIERVIREYVLVDTNISADGDWLREP